MLLLLFLPLLISLSNSQCYGDIQQYSVNWPEVDINDKYCITKCTDDVNIPYKLISCIKNKIYACKYHPDAALPEFVTVAGEGVVSKADLVSNIIIFPVEKCTERPQPYLMDKHYNDIKLYHELKKMTQNWKYLTNHRFTRNHYIFNDEKDAMTLIAPVTNGGAYAFRWGDDIINSDDIPIRGFEFQKNWAHYKIPKQFKDIKQWNLHSAVPGEECFSRCGNGNCYCYKVIKEFMEKQYDKSKSEKDKKKLLTLKKLFKMTLSEKKYQYCISKVEKDKDDEVSQADKKICEECSKDTNCHFYPNIKIKRRSIIYQKLHNDRSKYECISSKQADHAPWCKALIYYKRNTINKRTLNSAIISATEILNKKGVTITEKTTVGTILTKIQKLPFGDDKETVDAVKKYDLDVLPETKLMEQLKMETCTNDNDRPLTWKKYVINCALSCKTKINSVCDPLPGLNAIPHKYTSNNKFVSQTTIIKKYRICRYFIEPTPFITANWKEGETIKWNTVRLTYDPCKIYQLSTTDSKSPCYQKPKPGSKQYRHYTKWWGRQSATDQKNYIENRWKGPQWVYTARIDFGNNYDLNSQNNEPIIYINGEVLSLILSITVIFCVGIIGCFILGFAVSNSLYKQINNI